MDQQPANQTALIVSTPASSSEPPETAPVVIPAAAVEKTDVMEKADTDEVVAFEEAVQVLRKRAVDVAELERLRSKCQKVELEKSKLQGSLSEAERELKMWREWAKKMPVVDSEGGSELSFGFLDTGLPEPEEPAGKPAAGQKSETGMETALKETDRGCSLCFKTARSLGAPVRELPCRKHRICCRDLCIQRLWYAPDVTVERTNPDGSLEVVGQLSESRKGVSVDATKECGLCQLREHTAMAPRVLTSLRIAVISPPLPTQPASPGRTNRDCVPLREVRWSVPALAPKRGLKRPAT